MILMLYRLQLNTSLFLCIFICLTGEVGCIFIPLYVYLLDGEGWVYLYSFICLSAGRGKWCLSLFLYIFICWTREVGCSFIHLYICWSSGMAPLLFSCHSIALPWVASVIIRFVIYGVIPVYMVSR